MQTEKQQKKEEDLNIKDEFQVLKSLIQFEEQRHQQQLEERKSSNSESNCSSPAENTQISYITENDDIFEPNQEIKSNFKEYFKENDNLQYQNNDELIEFVNNQSQKIRKRSSCDRSYAKEENQFIIFHTLPLDQQLTEILNNKFIQYCFYKINIKNDVSLNKLAFESAEGHYLYKQDWERHKNGGLVFINQDKLKLQKKALNYISAASKNLITFQSPLKIGLPVFLFEKRSNLERLAFSFGLINFFLREASQSYDEIILYLSLEGPFNPILGETFQCRIGNCELNLEQISHHPPISAWHLNCPNYTYSGSFESFAELHINSFSGRNLGKPTIKFHNTGNIIKLQCPQCRLGGLTVGDRKFNIELCLFAYDLKNKLFSQVEFNPSEGLKDLNKFKNFERICSEGGQEDYFKGQIFRMNDEFFKKKVLLQKDSIKPKKIDRKDVIDVYDMIWGIWHQQFYFDDALIWDAFKKEHVPEQFQQDNTPLPSDSNFRPDIIYWKQNNQEQAQQFKDLLENTQRNDKKLRQKAKKTKKKK